MLGEEHGEMVRPRKRTVTLFVWLLILFTTSSSEITQFSHVFECEIRQPILSRKHLAASEMYFREGNLVSVVVLYQPSSMCTLDLITEILQSTFTRLNKTVLLTKINVENEVRDIWKADKETSDPCRDCTDSHMSYILVVDDEVTLLDYFSAFQRSQSLWNPRANFLVLVPVTSFDEQCNTTSMDTYLTLFNFLWKRHSILNIVAMPVHLDRCPMEPITRLVFYDPFSKALGKDAWGTVKYVDASALTPTNSLVTNRLNKNMNGYPVRVSMFERMTTAVLEDTENNSQTANYFGVDGYALAALSQVMGFTAITSEPLDGKEYGYLNGTFNGALGDILYGRADIAFNTRFIKDYGTDDIIFTHQLDSDEMCIIAPKAKLIPKWRTMAKCFNYDLYIVLLACQLAFALMWYFLKRIAVLYGADIRTDIDKAHILLDALHPFLNMPVIRIPRTNSERILVVCFLQMGMIVVSVFQGNLLKVIGHPLYYPDINTLAQLDESGLHIGTGSQNLDDVLYDSGNPVMHRLLAKIEHFLGGAYGPERVAASGNITALVRKGDALFRAPSFTTTDGMPLLHIIKECPRLYYLGYIVPKRSPFLARFNKIIDRMFESGIVPQWNERSINKLIDMNRINRTKGFSKTRGPPKVFSLVDIEFPFFILAVGLILATIVFIAEALRATVKRSLL